MFIRVGNEKIQYVKPNAILELNRLFNIIGYSNNSTFYRIDFVGNGNTQISCVGYDWSEYLQMIKYARIVVKKEEFLEVVGCAV